MNVAINMCVPFSVLGLSSVLQSGTNGLGMVPTGLGILRIDDEISHPHHQHVGGDLLCSGQASALSSWALEC